MFPADSVYGNLLYVCFSENKWTVCTIVEMTFVAVSYLLIFLACIQLGGHFGKIQFDPNNVVNNSTWIGFGHSEYTKWTNPFKKNATTGVFPLLNFLFTWVLFWFIAFLAVSSDMHISMFNNWKLPTTCNIDWSSHMWLTIQLVFLSFFWVGLICKTSKIVVHFQWHLFCFVLFLFGLW